MAVSICCLLVAGGLSITAGQIMDETAKIAEAGVISVSFEFQEPSLILGSGYYHVSMEGLDSFSEPGEPILPVKTVQILLPYGYDIEDVRVEPRVCQELPGNFLVYPGQEEFPLAISTQDLEYPGETQCLDDEPGPERLSKLNPAPSDLSAPEHQSESIFTAPNSEIYNSTNEYPGQCYEVLGVQGFRGYKILVMNLYPVSYMPATGEVSYFSEMNVLVNTRISRSAEGDSVNARGLESDIMAVSERVSNPEIVSTYQGRAQSEESPTSIVDPADTYEYVIITSQAFLNASGTYNFEDLITSKQAKGMTATIVTVEDIYADVDYSGADAQEEIRNFIIDAYNNWETEYILLGGDGDGGDVGGESGDTIIPHRGFYANAYGEIDEDIPSDIYYCCLDGDFNFDGDSYFGEPNDGPGGGEVDLMAEVYIGRAPVDNDQEISNFVMKTLAYETVTDDYLEEVLMLGELLWSDPTWGGDYKDEIAYGSWANPPIPDDFNTSTLYDRDLAVEWDPSDIISIINNDVHIINHLGHSNVNYCMRLYNSDVDSSFTNDRYFFGYSQGCYDGAFDNRGTFGGVGNEDCISEHFLGEPHGAFAFIGNSRYGWGEHMSTNGSSQYYDRNFFDALFGQDIRELGPANQYSKETNIGLINTNAMRWVFYELTLFGDPEVSIRDPRAPDHDVLVDQMDVQQFLALNTTAYVNTTILNVGLNNETNIEVWLTVDSVPQAMQTIGSLGPEDYVDLSFPWTTSSIPGVHNLGIEITPVPEENITINNQMYRDVTVGADIAIVDLNVDSVLDVFESTAVSATIDNLGVVDVGSFEVQLIVEGMVEDVLTVPSLMAGQSQEILYNWTPQWTGQINVQVNVVPLAQEANTANNAMGQTVLVTHLIYFEDVENGQNGWTNNGLWHISTARSSPDNILSSTHSWAYNDGVDYDNGMANSGSITSPPIDVSYCTDAILMFQGWYETETSGTSYDQRWVSISTDGGAYQTLGQLSGDPMMTWNQYQFNITPYLGDYIQLRFFFDTLDSVMNNYEGWYIDDIYIQGNLLDHDISVENITAPEIIEPMETCNAGVDVVNAGLNPENNILIQLIVDSFVEDSYTIPSLTAGSSTSVNLSWVPVAEGQYNITVQATPVANETYISNNAQHSLVNVQYQPDIWASPASYDLVVQAGEMLYDTLTIGNDGEGELFYNISSDAESVATNENPIENYISFTGGEGAQSIIYSSDFENDTAGTVPSGYVLDTVNQLQGCWVSNLLSHGGTNSLYLMRNTTFINWGFVRTLASFTNERFSSWVYFNNDADYRQIRLESDTDNMDSQLVSLVYFDGDSNIRCYNGTTLVDSGYNYAVGWHQIEMECNFSLGMYQIYYDGVKITPGMGVGFYDPTSTSVESIHFGCSNVNGMSEMWVDDVLVGEELVNLPFGDNFDGEVPGCSPLNWVGDSSYMPAILDISNSTSESNPNSLHLMSQSGTSAFIHTKTGSMALYDDGSISMSLYLPNDNGYFSVRGQSTEGDILNSAVSFQVGLDDGAGTISGISHAILYYDGSSYVNSGYTWTVGEWFDFEIKCDFQANCFDLWMNGVQILDNADFWNPVSEIRSLHYYAVQGNNEMYIDNVLVGEESQETPSNTIGWLSVVPDSGLVMPGNGTMQVMNETSYITQPADAGYEVSFNTSFSPIQDLALYMFIPGDQTYPLAEGLDYIANYTTGEITTIFGGVDVDWEFYTYYNVSMGGSTNVHDVIVNATMLDPGFYTANITVSSNDPDSPEIIIPVNLTVLSAPHDLAVLDIGVEGPMEAGYAHIINASIINQGYENETNLNVTLMVNSIPLNSTIIPGLDSSQQIIIPFQWTPMLEGSYDIQVAVAPVPAENITYNNQLNMTVNITADPNIWINPDEFNFTVEAGQTDSDLLEIGNAGLGSLNWSINAGGTGIYFVCTHTSDCGWWYGWENAMFIINTLTWLRDTHADGGDILLIWGGTAWNDAWRIQMTDMGMTWTQRSGSNVTGADLDPEIYPITIISEYMSNTDVANLETKANLLQQYVEEGGVLVDMIATNNVRRWASGIPGPFGVQTNSLTNEYSYMVEPDHPMLSGMTPPTTEGSFDTHAQIVVPPAGSTILMTAGSAPGGNPVACWLEASAPDSAPDWLTYSPGSGMVGPMNSSMVNVGVNATTLLPGLYQTTLAIESNDPDVPVLTVPVNLTVTQPARDLGVSGLAMESSVAYNDLCLFNATVHNSGLEDPEYNVTVDFIIGGILEDSVVIPELASGASANVGFQWLADFPGNTTVEINVHPAPGEILLWNNSVSGEFEIVPYPEIVAWPKGFNFTAVAGESDSSILEIMNNGFADLYYNITDDLTTFGGGNAVQNPGFEIGNFSSWIHQDLASPYDNLAVVPGGYTNGYFATGLQGNYSVSTGFDGEGPGNISISQDITLPGDIGDITFQYRAGWTMGPYGGTQDRIFRFLVEPYGGGSALYSETILTAVALSDEPDTGPLFGSVDISPFAGQDVRIKFEWYIPEAYTGPAQFELDNITINSQGGVGTWLSETPNFGYIPGDIGGGTSYVENETVYIATVDGNPGPLPLQNSNIVNIDFYCYYGDWDSLYLMEEGIDYDMDYANGTITLLWDPWIDDGFYAYYNYTSAGVVEAHNITADASYLAPGIYHANISVRSNDPDNPEIIIPVTFSVLQPEHDIWVHDMECPENMALNDVLPVGANITNQGMYSESVLLWLLENGTPIDSDIVNVSSNGTETVWFDYSPSSAGLINLTIIADPVPGETILFNNEAWSQVMVISVPEIGISPTEFEVSTMMGTSTDRTLQVFNNGTENLNYNVTDYTGSMSSENFTVNSKAYSWVDGITGGTAMGLSDDDFDAVFIPFDFPFYGTEYNMMYVCSNGWASFSYASGNIPGTMNLPVVTYPNTIFVLGDDWNPTAAGDVYWRSLTSPNRFVVTWYQIAHYSTGGSNTFEMVLYEDGTIECNYQNIETLDTGYCVGINQGDGIHATQWPSAPTDSFSLGYELGGDCPWLWETPESGNLMPESQENILVTFDATNLSVGTYYANISVESNDPASPEILIPVTFTVTPPPHDMAVESLSLKAVERIGIEVNISATIANLGTSDEGAVIIQLLVDGFLEDQQNIPFIGTGGFVNLTFQWMSGMIGDYDICVIVVPVTGETILDNNNLNATISFIDPGQVLLVDDDGGIGSEAWYYDSVIDLGYTCDVWDAELNGTPEPDFLGLYSVVIWFTGNEYSNGLTLEERGVLENYLTGGGKLYLSGGLIGYNAQYGGWESWYNAWLHASIINPLVGGTQTFQGTPMDEIGDGMSPQYMTGDACAELWGYSSYNTLLAPGTSSFSFANMSYTGMTKADMVDYRIVYSAFDFAGVNGQSTRNLLMYRILNWLGVDDIQPPQHSNEHPEIDFVTDQPRPIIWVHVTDNVEVDPSTIRLYICGFPVFYDLEPITGGYNVSYVHGGDYFEGDIPVRITAQDTSGNLMDFTWYWHLDMSPPEAWDIFPAPGSQTIDTNPRIRLNVTDIGGVSMTGLRLYVMNFAVWYEYQAITDGYNIWFDHPTGYNVGDVVQCRIVAQDSFGHWLDHSWNFTIVEAQTMQIPVQVGWNLISCPMELADGNLPGALSDADTVPDIIKWYDSTDPDDPWKTYNAGQPDNLNDLQEITCGMGLWVHIPNVTALGDGLLDLDGLMSETFSMQLHAGWNLVGYTSLTDRIAANTLPGECDMVAVCDIAEPCLVRDITDLSTVTLNCHCGYWVHVTSDTIWQIEP